jgi:hypothetical protein
MDWAIIKIFYTQDEVDNIGLDESTLRIHYYNASSDTWAEYDGPGIGGVDTEGHSVWANVSHFSLFGVFGSVIEGGKKKGGGGGGGGSIENETNQTNQTSENVTNPTGNQNNVNQEVTCETGYNLVDGKCVKETEIESIPFPWIWIVVIAIIVVVLIIFFIVGSKKKRY